MGAPALGITEQEILEEVLAVLAGRPLEADAAERLIAAPSPDGGASAPTPEPQR